MRLPQAELSWKGISNEKPRAATRASLERRSRRRRRRLLSRWSTTANCSSTGNNARKPLVQKAPVRASSQKGSASYAGSSGKATDSTNSTNSPLAVAAASAANR